MRLENRNSSKGKWVKREEKQKRKIKFGWWEFWGWRKQIEVKNGLYVWNERMNGNIGKDLAQMIFFINFPGFSSEVLYNP